MSALSDYIKARRESQFGTAQDMENYITASNGSWYHGKNTGSSAIGDLANVFGGSALASMGDFLTGLGTLNKDMAGNDELDYLNPLRQSLYGEDTANELNRIRALGREATAGSTIKAGQKLSDYGSDMVADHTKQGKAPDGKTWGEMDFTDRVLNSDYWTDPYGIGNDLAVMGGSLAGQAPIMAAIPGGTIAGGVQTLAKGLLGGAGKKIMRGATSKAARRAGAGLYKAGKNDVIGSMANWAARSAPTTALTNAGGIYSDLKEQGYSDSEIAQAMRNMMVDEIPQDFVTGAMTGLALSGKLGRVGLGKAGKKASRLRQGVQNFAINAPLDVTSEYFDEANQQRLQNKYTNKAYGEDIFHLTDDERAAGATAAAPALIPGLAGGARNTVLRGRSLKEAYNDYRKARSAKAVSNTIADTNREITNSVANANAWLDDNGSAGVINAPTTQTAPTAPTGGETMNAVSAAEPFMGQRMDNGENGCVEAVTKIGANGGNEFLANELKNGVVGVPKLVEDAGDKVVPFDENNVSEGDLIVYGDNDHVVMADGKGGYVGNSSSQQKVVQGDNYMDMGGLKPTKIIKTGGMSAPVADGGTNNADNSIGSYSGNADIDSMIDSAAKKYNLPPALLAALSEQESGFNPNAQSGMGAVGIMQLMPNTAEELGVNPNDVAENIEGGAKYLRRMLDMYDGDMEKALAAYNAGPGAMEEVGNDISKLSEETRNYVPSVMEKYRKFGGGESVNTGSNTDTEWNINADDVFGDVDNDLIDTVIDDFVGTAANDDTYAFPGLKNLLNHAAEDGYVNRKELANEGLEQFEQYLTDLLKSSDTDIARMAGQVATNRKDGHALNLITGALNSNNTPVIKQIADSYRKPIIRLLTNIGRVRKNAEQSENVGDSVPVNQNTTGVPKQQNEGSLADRIAEQQNRAGSTNLNVSTPDYLVSRDGSQSGTDGRAKKILRDIHDKRISDVQAQQMAAQAQISQEQAIAMAKASEDKNRRIAQAQALKSMAQANNVEIPQTMQPGLDAGAKKAIEAVQNLVAPTLEGEENNETESTKKTTPEEGIDTENKVQHTESEQGNEKAEVAVDNKEIETGTFRTEDGRTKYSVVIRKKLDKKKLKKLAKKHNGNSSNFEQRYAFSKESDRDGFVADVNAEFFGKDTQTDTAGKTKKTTSEGGNVTVTGDEFGEYKDIADLRKKAKIYYKENLQGTSVSNELLGEVKLADNTVDFTGKGISKAVSTSAKVNKLLLIKHLPQLIESAHSITTNENIKNKRNATQYTYLESSAEIDGIVQSVIITIFTDSNGNKYYNHILPKEEQNKRSLPVYPAQASNERDGIPAVSQQTSVTSNVAENGDKGKENADDDFHGFLDDKKPGAKKEIQSQLKRRCTNEFYGNYSNKTKKEIVEQMLEMGDVFRKRKHRYMADLADGVMSIELGKAAYLYFEYLKGIGYGKDDKANETAKTTGADDVTKNTAGNNKKTTSEGGVTLADGYRTESGKPLNEADKDEFVLKSDGSKEFGEISKDISDTIKEQTGITLNPGKIYLKVGNEKQGLIHAKKHESQAVEDGYNSIEDMIADVVTNFDQIYMRDSSGEDGHPTYSLVKHGNKNAGKMNNVSPVYFEIQDDGNGGYYVVITAMPMGDKTLRRNITKKDRLIYSNPGLDVATHSNDGAVFRDGENVGAGAHGGFPTSDKSNGLVTSNVAENDGESKTKNITSKQGKPLPKGGAGNTVEVVTDDGKTVNVRYHIVNVDKVIASNMPTSFFVNKKYPAELQPRNRQRAAMQTQVENMANNLRAEDLTVGRNLNQGAPIVRRDGVVLNGNGRALAIMTAYENGRADSYKEYILNHAAEFGLSDKDIANIRKADGKIMLVREVMDDMDGDTVTAITESTVGGSRLGAAEQAQADAKKITSGVLDEYVPNENNDITNTANRNFVGGILSKIINDNDSNAYTDNTGNVNKDGLERVKRALCSLAYGDSNVIDKMAESTDDNIANVSKALVQAAPLLAQVKLMIDKGVYQPYAISRCISEAVNRLQWIKDTGDMTVDEYLNQTGLFGEHADSEETKEIIRAFNDYRRSAKRIAAFLNKVASLIKAQSKTDEMSFDFGGLEQPMSLYEILTTARQYVDSGEYKTGMTDLLADNSGADNKKTTSEGGNVTVTGDEFGEYKDIADLRKKAIKYYSENLQGTSVENAKLGTIDIDEIGAVNFTGSGKGKVKNTSAKEEKLLVVKYLPQLISQATDISESEPVKTEHANEHFYYLHTSANINGKETPITITLIKRNDKKIQFYNHILPSLEKGNKNEPLVSSAPESSSNEALGTPTVSGSSDLSVTENGGESKRNNAMDNTNSNNPFGDPDVARAEMEKALGIKRIDKSEKKNKARSGRSSVPKVSSEEIDPERFAGIDISEEAEARAIAELKAALKKSANRLNANPVFDPDIIIPAMKLGKIYVAKGMKNIADFAQSMSDTIGESVRAWIKPVWEMLQDRNITKYDESQLLPMFKHIGAIMQDNTDAQFEEIYKGFKDSYGEDTAKEFKDLLNIAYKGAYNFYNQNEGATENELYDSTGGTSTRDSGGNNQNGMGDIHESGESDGEGGRSVPQTEKESGAQRSVSVHRDSTDSGRKTGNSGVQGRSSGKSAGTDSTGNKQLAGSLRDNFEGKAVDNGRNAESLEPSQNGRDNAGTVKKSDVITKLKEIKPEEVKYGNRRQIMNTVCISLTDGQIDDVVKADKRLFIDDGKGMMFTNGTGTGKTFTGLGVVKRMVQQGKKNILIIAPSDNVQQSWIAAGKGFFNLDITQLKDTKDHGEGIVITSYQNMTANDSLVERDWDMVVADECHHIMSSQGGNTTGALRKLWALTFHKKGFLSWFEGRHREIADEQAGVRGNPDGYEKSERDRISKEYNEAREKDQLEWNKRREKSNTKVLFLSATPFSYVSSIEYAEGYLFDYDDAEYKGSRNTPANGRQDFLIKHFGYNMRNGKLNKPDPEVNQDLMEINFNKWLKDRGVLSSRKLDVEPDYERGFILVDGGIGKEIDRGMDILYKGNYRHITSRIADNMKGIQTRYLLEAVKARAALKLIRQYLKTGKKIVVFHDFNKNEAINPFIITATMTPEEEREYSRLKKEHPELFKLDFGNLKSPIDLFKEEFGDMVRIFNGTVAKSDRNRAVKDFNDDDSNVKIILCQRDGAKEGISMHDTTGKHQRVMIDLGLGTKPTDMTQSEGRIYRTGVKTNAIIRYLNTGTNIEKRAFANTIASRATTAENLSMGEEARALRDAIVDGFMESLEEREDAAWRKYLPGSPTEGTGGKKRDGRRMSAISDYDGAISDYYTNQKKNSKTKAREGTDYYATPEPIGYKMVEWLGLRPGNRALEPSAGHGAISKYFGEQTRNTIIEPSSELLPFAKMRLRGGTTSKAINTAFEDFGIINKFDGIAMNPPYGHAGKTAMDHVAKAYKHLADGGRIVAVVPDSPSFDKRFDQWRESGDAKNSVLREVVKLPRVTFNRAGTSVATKILVLDKYVFESDNEEARKYGSAGKTVDLTHIESMKELFETLKDMSVPERIGANVANQFTVTTDEKPGYKHVALPKDMSMVSNKSLSVLARKYKGYTDNAYGGFRFKHESDMEKFIHEANRGTTDGNLADIAANTDVKEEALETVGESSENFTKGTHTDTRDKDVTYATAKLVSRLDREQYLDVNRAAKENGGYYSKWAKAFLFKNERDRDNFVKEADETLNKDTPQYSITDRANIAGEMTAEQFESEVRKAFPTAENFKNDGSEISFTLPNGSSVTVNLADHIAMARDKAGRDYGRNISDNEVAEGSYGGVGRDGFIELAKGSTPGTIFHEAYHFAKATALNDREKAFLKKRYKNEEEEAEAYRKWRLAKDRTGMFGKIWRKVQEIAEKMAGVLGIETKGRIFRSIESGEVYNRTANEQTSFEKKYSILTNDNSNEGFAQRIKNRFAGVLSHKKETENYRQTAMELLSDLTQCKIAWGKLDPELGAVYKKLCGVIRVAKPYDFARLMPAVGEAIAERLELNPTGEMSHYIADWIMTGAVNNGTAEAKEFARAMKANAYMSDKLLEVQGLFMKHFDEMSEDFHQKMISFRKPSKDKGVKDWFSDFAEKLYTDCVEELYPVDKLIKQIEAKTGEKFSEMNNPYIQYRMYRGWYGKAEALVEGNGKGDMEALQQMYPNVSFEGFKSLKTILQQVGAVKDRAAREAFSEYCVAKHVLDIHRHNLDIENEISENAEKIGKLEREDGSKTKIQKLKKKNQQLEEEWMETPYTADECEKIISESLEKYPAFEKGQKDLVRYSNRLVAILYDSGMISSKQANNIVGKWKNYVPMFREFEESEEIEFGDSMKAQTGSKRKVIDPLQSIIRNTYTTIQKSERNRCRLALANVCRCSDVGEYIEFVDKKGSPDMNDTVVVCYRGKRKYLVTDPSVARAVNGMDRVDRNTLLQIIRWPVKLARLCFVTINPAFAVRNVIRDGADAAIYSKYGFNPKDFVSGLIHSIAKDDMYWKWIAAGGGQSSRISLDRDYTQSAVDRLTKNRSGHWILRRVYDVLTKAGEYSEYATRIGVFEKNMRNFRTKEGRTARDSIISAAFMSRDLIDFARGGRYSRGLNKISLFANASIQGWDKFFRTFDPRDRKSFMRAAARLTFTVMIPALTIALMFRGDDWWEELPDWMKENNWCFKLGDTIIRIPKGQDVATRFFSNGIEKLISKKGKMNADLLNPLYDALPSLVPFGIVPIFEVVANYNSFTKGKVVPGYLERLPGDKQYNSSTSVLAKYLGEKTGYSPIKIDHLITGFTGNVGRGVGEFLNWIGRDKHSMPNITDLPIVNGVTYMPYKQPASVTRFYDKWDDIQKEHTLYKQTGRARNGYSESEYKRMNAVNKVLQGLAKEERKIVENQNLSNSERYDRQMAIQQKRMREVQKLNLK